MILIIQLLIVLFTINFGDAGYYGTSPASEGSYAQSDVQAPAYMPAYLNNRYTKTGGYQGTKTGYHGTKTGFHGTKTGYGGTKTGYHGPKTGYGSHNSYSETKTWHSGPGNAPSYREFQGNANMPFAPVCEPQCMNNGICVDTNTCQCPPDHYGAHCEFKKKPCLTFPPMPLNSKRRCSSEMCVVTCMEGHKFIDGTSVANMRCVDGQWQPSRADFTSIPDCQPECDPPCLSGGVCLARNTCQCPADYRGPQCQYSTSACDIRKLAFNGGYSCFGDSDSFTCRLHCPAGAKFSSPAADTYVCHYATGQFEPQPIPHCEFQNVVVITPSNYRHNSSYSISETGSGTESSYHESHLFGQPENPMKVVVQDFTPKEGTCFTWAGSHYKTFDGNIYSFQSPCQHILVRDAKEHKYTVAVTHGNCTGRSYCPSDLTIYLEDKPYMLSVADDGSVVFRSTKRLIPIPAFLPGIRVSMPSDYILVTLDAVGIAITWDINNFITVEGSVLVWNNTEGLCGRLDGNPSNDLATRDGRIATTSSVLASSWQMNKIGDTCDSNPTVNSGCAAETDDVTKKALQFCTKIFSMDKFRKCSKVMDVSLLLEACKWDYCTCSKNQITSSEECACSTVAVYAKECLRHGVDEIRSWRDADTCPMKCPEGKLYRACGPSAQASCAAPEGGAGGAGGACVEGCFCPSGLLLEAGRCVPRAQCPCRLRNKAFPPGHVIKKDCNTCTCQSGEWTCTAIPCGARCGAVGDPHYTTFDGLRYDFMGHCTYTMLQAENITIEVENVACSGAITEAMNLSPYKGEGKPSCTKAVNLIYGAANVHMKQGGFILVNGKEVSSLPVTVGDVRIRAASSLFIIVQMPNKVDLWWDGNTRVFVDVPPEFHDKTKGLCGTFNLNQKDDFLTPENDIEQSALAFANKWKTREYCTDVATKEPEHPCKVNVENKEAAERYCSKLHSNLFEPCHWHIDVEPYYAACVYDMCACAGDVARCLCALLGDYAMTCAKAGVMLQWRYNVKECELSCTGGQEYTVCADSCLRKCSDMALVAGETCRPSCVEGCACPAGQLLDDSGVCVPVGLCPCYHKGLQFNAGYKEVRPGRRERELCTCMGGLWECVAATPEQIQNYPPAEDLRSNCSAANFMEFTTCEVAEPLTCKNMHLPPTSTSAECRPGCQCKKGYVLDTVSKRCVLARECPCHHGGRSYPDGHHMQEECNICECKSGKWSCSQRKCAGVCAAWGDSHLTTFDGTDYDFEGVCTYLLAKGTMDDKDGFNVEIQNVPCGTTGATCSKSITLTVGSGGNEEMVSLTKHTPVPDISKLKRIKMRIAGAYVFLDVPSLGMSLQWDHGLRVYVRVDSMWRGRVKGLCGNYNGDMRDDFQSPSGGGIAETSALIFADSWKLKSTCPKPQAAIDHCQQRPERKQWAVSVCGAMKRYPFTLCESEVSATPFVVRCERDACACDSGADCDCACAALAAYAHACAERGVTFRWRSQELCPMQCDEECSNYDSCVSPCPIETCDNTLDYTEIKTNCEQTTCVEGCKPKKSCPEGQVYSNSTLQQCVPRAKCKPVCMTLADGTEVLEGEILEEDACHACRCSKKQKVCKGLPCSTEAPQLGSSEPSPKPHDEPLKCLDGWTPWINRGPPEIGPNGESIDNEPLPKPNELKIGEPMCKQDMMKKIECRTVDEHKSPKETGLDVECSLERGLVCKEVGKTCADFEIRVFCDCGESNLCYNTTRPNEPHPTDCTKFYECSPSGPVLKDCGPGTMYNPESMVCDWPHTVIALRPECGTIETTRAPFTSTTQASTTGAPACPPGQVLSQCAFPCDKLCDHFRKTLQDQGLCTFGQKCVEGCIDQSVANIKCDYGSYWRDNRTCVPLKDCTCYSQGDIIKPGGVVTTGCIKCQCLDNALHCDSTECVSIDVPLEGSTHQPYVFHTPPATTTITSTSTVPSTVTTPATVTTPSTITTPSTVTVPSTVTTPATVTTPSTITTPSTVTTPATVTTPSTIATQSTVTSPAATKSTFYSPSTPASTTTITTPLPTSLKTLVVVPECEPSRYINLLAEEALPPSSFSASSVDGDHFKPQYVLLNTPNHTADADSWIPKTLDSNQYVQVELPRREPIYGLEMAGSQIADQFVTSYELMYGDDGSVYNTVDGPDGKPKVFHGPTHHREAMKQMIEPPIEAKFIRIRPLTWHQNIAVRIELIGCQLPENTTTTVTTVTTETVTVKVSTTTAAVPTTPIIVKTTATPPPQCAPDSYINLLWGEKRLPASSFTASSTLNSLFEPQYAILNERPQVNTAGSWSPEESDRHPYIQVELAEREPIYGVWLQGSPLFDQYVSSYQLMYGDDGTTYSTVDGPDGKPKIFRGPVDRDTPTKQMIEPPIEAKFVRLMPLTWNEGIAVRFDLIGCEEPTSTTWAEFTSSEAEESCSAPLGLGAELPIENIEVSSNIDARRYLSMDATRGWRPLYSTPGEWIMFDFTSPRNITGIATKGGEKGWVKTYTVMYTSDHTTFNPVVDSDKTTKVFAGNYDQDTQELHVFRPPIRARYLKLLPATWKDTIEMRIEPIGCFEPYPTTESIPSPVSTTPASACEVCPGVSQGMPATGAECSCSGAARYFDGDDCVTRDQCPCLQGFITYAVGSAFRGYNCDECVCKLGGVSDCKPVKECQCAPDLVPKLSPESCECLCQPCPAGTRICPTSKVCLAEDLWCNGLQDCPDDETNCATSTTPTTITTETTHTSPSTTNAPTTPSTPTTEITTTSTTTEHPTTAQECPVVACPPGYSAVSAGAQRWRSARDDLPPPRPRYSYQRYQRRGAAGAYTKTVYTKTGFSKGGYVKGPYGGLPPPPQTNNAFTLVKPTVTNEPPIKQEACPQVKCIPKFNPLRPNPENEPCSVLSCPKGYTLKLDHNKATGSKCPQFDCVPPPERPVFCNMTGRTFNTFDGTEYKYDVCYHVLARDSRFDAWLIIVRKKCHDDSCQNELLVVQDGHAILVKPSLMIEYDNYEYTIEQTSKICFQKNSFDVARLGDGVSITSRKYNFTILYNTHGDVKIGVYKQSALGAVDGLCGFFDGAAGNDKRLPDGRAARSTVEFARGWAKPGLPADACQAKPRCAPGQQEAWDMCQVVTQEPLSTCGGILNLDKWRRICLEKICDCAGLVVNGTKMTPEQCRCVFLEQMVAECLAADRDLDLDAWRVLNNCPASCPAPLVHYACYRRSCEPSCGAAGPACAPRPGLCAPGCYCPEGTLRRGDDCIAPRACRDCECNGLGTPAKYVTFEGDFLPSLGNCTYVASRHKKESMRKYEVWATNGPCEENNAVVCTKSVSIGSRGQYILVTRDPISEKLQVAMGLVSTGAEPKLLYEFPVLEDWVTIKKLREQDISVYLQSANVEVTVLQSKLEFHVKVPSALYANQTEGLCGVCAGTEEALLTSNGTVTDDFDVYADSWRAPPPGGSAGSAADSCGAPPPPACVPPPPDSNPCYNLYNKDKFGACHALVEPGSFVSECEEAVCAGASDACAEMLRYAAACRRAGVCLPAWRDDLCPYPCEAPLVYRACVDCERTCENYEELTQKPENCIEQPAEGCFCPEGKVRVNNTCIEPTKCFPCDADKKHYAGDEWQQSECVKCTCSKSPSAQTARRTCTEQACAPPACGQRQRRVERPRPPGHCCPEYVCVTEPESVNCEEPKKIQCGFGQVLKEKTLSNGCKDFVCECMPEEECERAAAAEASQQAAQAAQAQPGMQLVEDRSGCCPRGVLQCRPEACPPPPACEPFHDLRRANVSGLCCPQYSCELPKDKCVVKLEWEASAKGGEMSRTTPQTVVKDVDSSWTDGPCRSCRCERAAGGLGARCTRAECARAPASERLLVAERPAPFACCPRHEYVACRDGANVYQPGENWTAADNPCEKLACVRLEDDTLERRSTHLHCDKDCQPGWKYEEAEPSSGECCGKCKPVACVVGGLERPVGTKWTSLDFCTNYTCVLLDGTLQVQSANETCQEMTEAMLKQFVFSEERSPTQCCAKYEPIACRVGDKVYQEGQSWVTADPCKNVTCSRDAAGSLAQAESTQACARDCPRGSSYGAAAPGHCCGRCLPSACLLNDTLIAPGTTWQSADNCTSYSCDKVGDEVFVTAAKETCADVSGCRPEDLENGTCCQVCREKPQALSTCVPTSVPPAETIGLISLTLGGRGLCVNDAPIAGFKECRGSCDSGTTYNNVTGIHEAQCECCVVSELARLPVVLRCRDGRRVTRTAPSAAACSCERCGAERAARPSATPPYGHYNVKNPHKDREEYDIPDIYQRFGENSPRPRL